MRNRTQRKPSPSFSVRSEKICDARVWRRRPERVARALAFLTSGASKAPVDVLNGAVFKESYEGMVLVQDIEFYSLCEHHLLPFHGRAHIAYLPAGRVLGLSKLPRLLDIYARRLQVQERLTEQVARAVQQAIGPRGVAVRIEAAHFCMMMRGVEKQQSLTVTTSFLGAFDRGMDLRQEFFSSLRPLPRGENPGPRETRLQASFPSSPPRDDAAPGVAEGPDGHRAGRFGVFAPDPPPVPRGKYPQRVGPRPRAAAALSYSRWLASIHEFFSWTWIASNAQIGRGVVTGGLGGLDDVLGGGDHVSLVLDQLLDHVGGLGHTRGLLDLRQAGVLGEGPGRHAPRGRGCARRSRPRPEPAPCTRSRTACGAW